MVAIARALKRVDGDWSSMSPTLVLDEPTSSLPAAEVGRVFDAMRVVAHGGGIVIWVTHRLDEVMQLADDVAVLREGRVVGLVPRASLVPESLVEMILGRGVTYAPAAEGTAEQPAPGQGLEVRALNGRTIRDVSFRVAHGEILGIGGIVGCGRSELLRIVAGAQRPASGMVLLEGNELPIGSPRDRLSSGIAYVPQDRLGAGCIPQLNLRVNMTLPNLAPFWRRGLIDLGMERRSTMDSAERFNIRPRDTEKLVALFSGGNQQRCVLARALRLSPKVLLLDEPTQGVDIGARLQIFSILKDVARAGVVVVVGSTDNEELSLVADRVIIMDRGRIAGEVTGESLTDAQLTLMAATSQQH
jgi:ABC-type sugar transport system ATPase subunit